MIFVLHLCIVPISLCIAQNSFYFHFGILHQRQNKEKIPNIFNTKRDEVSVDWSNFHVDKHCFIGILLQCLCLG